MALKQIGNKKSLSDRAYEVLKEAIITGTFQQGQILTEEQLANELAISRTPVRSAVKRLEYEGLVEISSSKNIIVSMITEKDIEDALAARQLVEVEVCGLVAESITKSQCRELYNLVELQKKAYAGGKTSELIEYETMFHSKIGEYCGNVWYEKMLESIAVLQKRVLMLGIRLENNWERAFEEHYELVQVLESHDVKKARELMAVHIGHGQPVLNK